MAEATADSECVVVADRCPHKQARTCYGQPASICVVNWLSCDPEDLEPYEEYVADCLAKDIDVLTGRPPAEFMEEK